MRYEHNLSELTRLLELYYSGNSTSEQERRLLDIMSLTPPDMLPDDIRRQQPMFRTLRSIAADDSSVTMPDKVAMRLDHYVDSMAAASSRRRSTMIGMICGFAASIAAAVAVTVMLVNIPWSSGGQPSSIMAGQNDECGMTSSDIDSVGRALRRAHTTDEFTPMRVKESQHTSGIKDMPQTDGSNGIMTHNTESSQ